MTLLAIGGAPRRPVPFVSSAAAPAPKRHRRERSDEAPLPAVVQPVPADLCAELMLNIVSGHAGSVWRALLEAGINGLDEDTLAGRVYGASPVPVSWGKLVDRHVTTVRILAAPHSLVIDRFQNVEPRRWRLRMAEAPAAELEAAGARPTSPHGKVPDLTLPAAELWVASLRRGSPPTIAPATFSGAARAVMQLQHRDCRWTDDDVREDGFRFCCRPVVSGAVRPYCAEHQRVAISGSTA